jgi:serine/threonine-protein kinase RsbW
MLCCQVSDDGPGVPSGHLNGAVMPDVEGIGGRGLWLIGWLADEVTIITGAQGTQLWMAFRLPP